MTPNVEEIFMKQNHWQDSLDRQQEVFSGIFEDARIGILPKPQIESEDGKVLVWEVQSGKMSAGYRPFTGFRNAEVDMLFVADEQGLVSLYENGGEFKHMKNLIREGSILFYVFKTKNELLDLGYEDFLDALGLAFMGGCR